MNKVLSHISPDYDEKTLCGFYMENLGVGHSWCPPSMVRSVGHGSRSWHVARGYEPCPGCWDHPMLELYILADAL